ncbi:hypothetical protein BDW74DRAFT_181097 [Aspergillus multicolor]|uniref:uncharacterized protein n=1 Tax=Aspergillus multicolor TaxID=41759 RepID=UPI003CCE117B
MRRATALPALAAVTLVGLPLPSLSILPLISHNTHRPKQAPQLSKPLSLATASKSSPGKWTRPPNGPTVLLNGTVQEIYAELLKINPSYDGDFAETLAAAQAAAETESKTYEAADIDADADAGIASLHKRLPVTCNNYDEAITRRIREGITYLRGVSGRPSNGPGPGNCGRVSCSYNSAIWWCNDNTSSKTLPGFNNIADGAQVVINHCAPTDIYVAGEEDHNDNWRAVVRRSPC